MKQFNTVRGPLRRVSPDVAHIAQQVLMLAAIGGPDDQTQRKAFIKIIPSIYVARKRMGATFKEITVWCSRCGLNLSESTVRAYYSQLQPQLQQECDAMMEKVTRQEEAIAAKSRIQFPNDSLPKL